MALLTTVVHLAYNLSSTAYTAYMIHISNSTSWSHALIYWTGSLMFSTSLSLICCDFFTVIDRTVAIQRPILYTHKHKTTWIVFAALVAFAFAANIGVYEIGRIPIPSEKLKHFRGVVHDEFVDAMYYFKSGISAVNVPLTLYFLWRLKQFTTRTLFVDETLKTANQIVVYQMLAEIGLIIIPTLLTSLIDWIGDISITTIVGSYPNALYVFYTTFFAVSLATKLGNSSGTALTPRLIDYDSTRTQALISFVPRLPAALRPLRRLRLDGLSFQRC
ncbi:hypothetical protein QR680_010101 [Steinernema hermaphroditum]|uniref:7TM GPCR serpentine receptor class x (Srx) domain-containing protein n=1 Tax=Steinernema hermaphroditum TaxID=289476 RepID=A0AA39IPN2_9BILA|nr:hypothetical protein QR680_010101 [Steinernema hermaphroditum]